MKKINLKIFLVISFYFLVFLINFEVNAFESIIFSEGKDGVFILEKPEIIGAKEKGKVNVNLDWEDYTFNIDGEVVGANYFTVRRPINLNKSNKGDNWEIRGKYGATINVLSVYPNLEKSAGLKSWMENQSSKNDNVDIRVTSQSQSDFNENPYRYLNKNSDGTYNYDVIVFGFWDSYNNARINSRALDIVQDFIDGGYGVIFGHDVVQTSKVNKGFNDIVENNMDIFLTPPNRPTWYVSNKISVNQQGSLTTYPFDVNGMDLTIPMTHTVAQFPGDTKTGVPNDDIVYMTLEPNYYPTPGEGPYFNYNILTSARGPETRVTYKQGTNPKYSYIANAYLLKQNNVAFIQTGHTSGESSEAEQMIIANLIYSLAQISGNSNGIDQLLDTAKPITPSDSNGDLIFESTDLGVGYEYRIIATPIGYDINSIDVNSLKKLLSTEEVKYNDLVVFSNSFVSSNIVSNLKGSIGFENEEDNATFRYYIDKNPNDSRIPTIEVPGNEDLTDDFFTLNYNEPFNYLNHFTDIDKVNDDDYLHIVAYDRANNASETANYRIKDILKKTDVTIVYDYNNTPINTIELLGKDNPNQLVDSKFSITSPKNIEVDGIKYIYSHTKPESSFIVLQEDTSQNVITHFFDKLVKKDIYIVETTPSINGSESTNNIIPYLSEEATSGKVVSINSNLPENLLENFNYMGWSKGTSPDYGNYKNDETFVWADDNENIYLYYEKKISNIKVDIVRSDGKEFEAGVSKYIYEKEGYVGENITITGSDISSNISINNSIAYSNINELKNYEKEFLLQDNGNNIDEITLIPRTINVVGIGINYGETTSSSAIEVEMTSPSAISIDYAKNNPAHINKNLFNIQKTYDMELIEQEFVPATIEDINGGSHWKNYYDEINGSSINIDYSSTNDIQVPYYKGVKPNEAYTVEANYLNVIDNISIDSKYESGTLSVTNHPNIPIKAGLSVEGLAIDRSVDFTLDYYEVEFNGSTYIYDKDVDLNNKVPFRDEVGNAEIGDYTVNIYYRPYSRIYYTEEVYDITGTQLISSITTNYNVLYTNEKKSLKSTYPLDEYEVEVSSNGFFENGEISTIVKDYDNYILVKYIPMVYNLQVEVISDYYPTEYNYKNHYVYEFKNIPVKNSITLTIPNYENSNYYFEGASIVENGNEGDFFYSEDGKKIIFDPYINPTTSGLTYKMDLKYNLKGEVKGVIKVFKNAEEPSQYEITEELFVGDEIDIKIVEAEGFVLTNAYLDGKEYTNIETDKSYTMSVKKPMHLIELIYRESKYDIKVEERTFGGYGYGSGSYYAGEKVYINAYPDDGFKIEYVDIEKGDINILKEEGTVDYYYFIMPKEEVVIGVYFTEDKVNRPYIPEIEEDKENEVIENIDDKEEKEEEQDDENEGFIKPEPPIKPIYPTEEYIYTLVDNPYYKIIRHYKPYLFGYPNGNIGPEDEITRSEVMSIIYNLYGNGYVPDNSSLYKFYDVDIDNWYSDAIAFGVDFGIINGYDDGTFKPNSSITREELAFILAKFVPNDDVIVDELHFNDITYSWSTKSIEKLYRKGIVSGYGDNTFRPKGTAKRSEFITLVNNLIGRGDTYNTYKTFKDLPENHWAYDNIMNASNGTIIDIEFDEIIIEDINN